MADIEPPLLTNSQTFHAPALAHTVKPALVTNTQTFFGPTITQQSIAGRASHRGRRVAYQPILDNAIRARAPMRFRAVLRERPDSFTERRRIARLTSKTDLSKMNSASYAAQVAYGQSPGEDGGDPSRFLFGA